MRYAPPESYLAVAEKLLPPCKPETINRVAKDGWSPLQTALRYSPKDKLIDAIMLLRKRGVDAVRIERRKELLQFRKDGAIDLLLDINGALESNLGKLTRSKMSKFDCA